MITKSPLSNKDNLLIIMSQQQQLSVLQWNILADHLSGSSPNLGGFDDVTAELLNWNTRKAKIIATITDFMPDVITLQECDHFTELAAELSSYGYVGHFAMKPASAPEGICIFLKTLANGRSVTKCITFTYVDSNGHQSNQPAIILEVQLGPADNNRCIIATTHLKATKTAAGEQIRQHQISQLLSHIAREHSPTMPIILCGDFNAMPVTDTTIGSPLVYNTVLQHPLNFRSAFDVTTPTSIKSRGGTLTSRCIDYIWYTNAKVKNAENGYCEPIEPIRIDKTRCLNRPEPEGPPREWHNYDREYHVIYSIPADVLANDSYYPLEELEIDAPEKHIRDDAQICKGFPSDHAYLYAEFVF